MSANVDRAALLPSAAGTAAASAKRREHHLHPISSSVRDHRAGGMNGGNKHLAAPASKPYSSPAPAPKKSAAVAVGSAAPATDAGVAQHKQADKRKKKKKRNDKHNSIVPDVIEERHRGSDDVDVYDKGKYLGKGGFARCYTLTSRTTGAVYAGKVVAKSSLKKTKAQQKLVAEIKIHQHLHNPNVVRFYRSFQDKHNVYILLELCSNQSLMELMKKRKRLTEPEVRYYFLQILEAVQYLHRNNVIHRDLKLGNLFLNKDLQVKLGDMGLSTKLENADERKKTICGTPNYIAPEVISGGTHSFEVDVWSLGVILFTMLVGKPPFETRDVKATYKRIKRGQFNFPETVKLSRDARLLIESLLQLVPEKRPTISQIRSHSFFTRPGAFTPRTLPVSALSSVPKFATPAMRGSGSTERAAVSAVSAVSAAGGAVFQTLKPSSRSNTISSSKKGGRVPPSPLVRPPSKLQLLVKGTEDSPRNLVINGKNSNNCKQQLAGHRNDELWNSADNASTPITESRVPITGRRAPQVDAAAAMVDTEAATSAMPRPSSAAGYGARKRSGGALREDTSQRPQTARMTSSAGEEAHRDKKVSLRHRHADRLAALNQRLGRMELRAFSGNSDRYRDTDTHHDNMSAGGGPPSSDSSSSTHGATTGRSENSAPSTVVSAVSSTRSSLSSLPEGQNCKATATMNGSGPARHSHHMVAAPAVQTASSSSGPPKMSTLKAMHRELSRSLLDGGMDEADQRVSGIRASSGKCGAPHARHGGAARYGNARGANVVDAAFATDRQHGAVSKALVEDHQIPVVPPKVWVVRHVDYTRKYGFGYLLSNGAVGVYFNDSTKIILNANNQDFEYIERMRSTSTLSHPPRHAHTLESYPDSLKKKVTLLVHFKAHLCGAEKKDATSSSGRSSAGGSNGGMAVAGSGGGDAAATDSAKDRDATGGMTYVKKWVRTNRCLLFRLSDRSVQVAFFDNTEVILSQAGGSSQDLDGEQNHGSITLTYVDKDKTRTSYSLQGVMESSKAHILKRLRYTKSVIHELLSGKLSNPKGGSKKSTRSGGDKVKK
jgi:polo-like kinase 1